MKETHLRRLLNRLVLMSLPVPALGLGLACSSNETDVTGDSTGASGSGGFGSPQDGGSGSAGAGSESGGAAGSAPAEGGYSGSSGGGGGIGGNDEGAAGSAGAAGGGGTGDASLHDASLHDASLHDAGADAGCQGAASFQCAPFAIVIGRQCLDVPDAQVGAILAQADCARICNVTAVSVLTCSLSSVAADSVTIACSVGCAVGRRPEGLLDGPKSTEAHLGSYFAEVSHLEAASVIAFKRLRDELASHGAPRRLVRAAARAARDEIRHARVTAALARRFGATARSPVVEKRSARSLEQIAVENAVEGCVRETFGALVATWQAQRADDPVVRAAMKRVARDETRHAALSWNVAHWMNGRLERGARDRVAEARFAAASELRDAHNATDCKLARVAGVPTSDQQRQLVEQMARELWHSRRSDATSNQQSRAITPRR